MLFKKVIGCFIKLVLFINYPSMAKKEGRKEEMKEGRQKRAGLGKQLLFLVLITK